MEGITDFHSGCRYRKPMLRIIITLLNMKSEEDDNNKIKKKKTTICEIIPERDQEYLGVYGR